MIVASGNRVIIAKIEFTAILLTIMQWVKIQETTANIVVGLCWSKHGKNSKGECLVVPIKKYCQKCGHELESWSIGWYCANCGCFEDMSGNVHEKRNEPFMPPKTNADKIRSMTDEELADFIQRVEIGDFNCNDYGKTFCDMCDGQYECDDCLKYWLKQPAEGE